jgi:hypothetical protein
MDNEDIPKKTYLISGIAKIFNGVLKKPDSTFTDFSKAFKATFNHSSQQSLSSYWTTVGKEILTVLKEPHSLMFKLGNVHHNKIAMARVSLSNSLQGRGSKQDDLTSSIILNLLKDLDEMKKSMNIKEADRVQIIQFEDKLKACMESAQNQINSRSSKRKG